MNNATSSLWNQPGEPTPLRGDPVRDIADYVWDTCWEMLERAPTRRELRLFCESRDYVWSLVARELKRGKLIHINPAHVGRETTRTPGGVLIDKEAFSGFVDGLGDLVTRCPTIVPWVNTRTLSRFKVPRHCWSWCCPDCAAEMVDETQLATRKATDGWVEVFVAKTPWEPKLLGRVGDRKRSADATVCWFRRADDTVYLFADKPLDAHGSKPPTSWEKLTHDDAMRSLTDEILALPGLVGHWMLPERASRKKHTNAVPETVSLESMRDDMVERVIELTVREIVHRGWDFRPFTDDAVPPHLHAALVGVIKDAKDKVWASMAAD